MVAAGGGSLSRLDSRFCGNDVRCGEAAHYFPLIPTIPGNWQILVPDGICTPAFRTTPSCFIRKPRAYILYARSLLAQLAPGGRSLHFRDFRHPGGRSARGEGDKLVVAGDGHYYLERIPVSTGMTKETLRLRRCVPTLRANEIQNSWSAPVIKMPERPLHPATPAAISCRHSISAIHHGIQQTSALCNRSDICGNAR